jgi:hypothetical protein
MRPRQNLYAQLTQIFIPVTEYLPVESNLVVSCSTGHMNDGPSGTCDSYPGPGVLP